MFQQNLKNTLYEEFQFQQDGATPRTAVQTIDSFEDEFDDKIISRNGPVTWPPISFDLIPLEYF